MHTDREGEEVEDSRLATYRERLRHLEECVDACETYKQSVSSLHTHLDSLRRDLQHTYDISTSRTTALTIPGIYTLCVDAHGKRVCVSTKRVCACTSVYVCAFTRVYVCAFTGVYSCTSICDSDTGVCLCVCIVGIAV